MTSSEQQVVIRATWLSLKPHPLSAFVSALCTFTLALISLIYWKDIFNAQSWMPASGKAIFENHEFWRAWSSLFIHSDEAHLFSNSFLFFILGTFLAGHFGYFIFPILALFVGGLVNLFVIAGMPAEIKLIGASGIVFWMGGTWLILYFFLDRQRSLYQRAIRSIGVGLLLFVPAEAFNPSISYMSHWVGFLAGVISGALYFLIFRHKFRAAEVKEIIIEEPLPDLN